MESRHSKSIGKKLVTVVLLAIVPSLLLASVIGAFREYDYQRRALEVELKGIAAALASTASEAVAAGDVRQIANTLKGISAVPHISHVSARGIAGQLLFQFGSGIIVNSSKGSEKAGYLNLQTFPVEAEIRHAGAPAGTILLIADVSDLRHALSRNLISAVLSAILSGLVGLMASYRMQKSISQPIVDLTKAMSDVREQKDFSRSVTRNSDDEAGLLVDSFNDMMREIRDRDDALADHREGLERQVAQRTHDLALAVDDAQSANRAKSEFLATMSHEIRTPMNGMLVMAELMAASDLNARAQRHCEVILRSGQTLMTIINDILDLSKIEAGQMTLEAVPVDPARMVDDVLKLFSARAASKGLDLVAYLSPDVPAAIVTDPVRLSQILSNLVNNALKFTEKGGVCIAVETSAENANIRFVVSDTGIGIASEKLDTIFDPFTQSEQSTTRRFGGTGIGLTICRKLAAAMGGRIWAESAAGTGSKFTFEALFEVHVDGAAKTAVTYSSGNVLLALSDGPLRRSLARDVRDAGLQPITSPDMADNIRAIVATSDHLSRVDQRNVPVLVLTRLGEGIAGRNPQLEMPATSASFRAALDALLAGKALEPARGHDLSGASSGSAPFSGVRVLAADDNAINREVLVEALHRLGAAVTCVEDGKSAIAAAKSGAFDLIFMDGSMPDIDGFEATRAIRLWEQENALPPTPVVGLSAHAIGGQVSVWQACGMSDFIIKPFTLAAIRKCLETWVRQQAANDAAALDTGRQQQKPGAPASCLIDETVLASIREMQEPGDDLVERISALYIKQAPLLLEQLMDFELRPDDVKGLALAAHALKSMSRNVGAVQVGDLCGLVEDEARAGHFTLDAQKSAIEKALRETLIEMRNVSGSACPAIETPAYASG